MITAPGEPMSFRSLWNPEAVKLALSEFDELGRTAFLEKYGFRRSRMYMLRDPDTGNLYDCLAIIGAAYGYAFPDEAPIAMSDIPDDEAVAERVLTDLGFEVVRVGQDWSKKEVEATIRDYFQMLTLESARRPYSKSDHNARLRSILKIRSRASIELKHQNISAVLAQLGLPFIRGYKPRANLQQLLREEVLNYIVARNAELTNIMDNLQEQTDPGQASFRGVLVEPPKVEAIAIPSTSPRLPRKFDYADRDERNRKLGRSGESWTVEFERVRLTDEGRPDLAARVDWLSERLGDGAGYDIMSYEASELARFIEVKTTNGGPETPFVVSRNEKEFSEEMGDSFCLYRVFSFSSVPKLFILRGSIASHLTLHPIDFRAHLKSIL